MTCPSLITHSIAALLTIAAVTPVAYGATAAEFEGSYTVQAGIPTAMADTGGGSMSGKVSLRFDHHNKRRLPPCLAGTPARLMRT